MPVCPNCKTKSNDDSKFCKECGSQLMLDPLYCIDCGKLTDGDSKFCKHCGSSNLKENESTTYEDIIDFFEKISKF